MTGRNHIFLPLLYLKKGKSWLLGQTCRSCNESYLLCSHSWHHLSLSPVTLPSLSFTTLILRELIEAVTQLIKGWKRGKVRLFCQRGIKVEGAKPLNGAGLDMTTAGEVLDQGDECHTRHSWSWSDQSAVWWLMEGGGNIKHHDPLALMRKVVKVCSEGWAGAGE